MRRTRLNKIKEEIEAGARARVRVLRDKMEKKLKLKREEKLLFALKEEHFKSSHLLIYSILILRKAKRRIAHLKLGGLMINILRCEYYNFLSF